MLFRSLCDEVEALRRALFMVKDIAVLLWICQTDAVLQTASNEAANAAGKEGLG